MRLIQKGTIQGTGEIIEPSPRWNLVGKKPDEKDVKKEDEQQGAGLRIGWGYAPAHIIDVLNRVRGPFNLSQAALNAATAAIKDTGYAAHCRSENAKWRSWMADALAEIGVPSDVSCANFILARFKSQDEAEACDEYLKTQGLIVRRVAGYQLLALATYSGEADKGTGPGTMKK